MQGAIKVVLRIINRLMPELKICVISFMRDKQDIIVTVQNKETGFSGKVDTSGRIVLKEDADSLALETSTNEIGLTALEILEFVNRQIPSFSFSYTSNFVEISSTGKNANFRNSQYDFITLSNDIENKDETVTETDIQGIINIPVQICLSDVTIPAGRYVIYRTTISDELLLENTSNSDEAVDYIINHADLESLQVLFADTLFEVKS